MGLFLHFTGLQNDGTPLPVGAFRRNAARYLRRGGGYGYVTERSGESGKIAFVYFKDGSGRGAAIVAAVAASSEDNRKMMEVEMYGNSQTKDPGMGRNGMQANTQP